MSPRNTLARYVVLIVTLVAAAPTAGTAQHGWGNVGDDIGAMNMISARLNSARARLERCGVRSRIAASDLRPVSLRVWHGPGRVDVSAEGFPDDRRWTALLRCLTREVRRALSRVTPLRYGMHVDHHPFPTLVLPNDEPAVPMARLHTPDELQTTTQQLALNRTFGDRIGWAAQLESQRNGLDVASAVSVVQAAPAGDRLLVASLLCRLTVGARVLPALIRAVPTEARARLRARSRGRCGTVLRPEPVR